MNTRYTLATTAMLLALGQLPLAAHAQTSTAPTTAAVPAATSKMPGAAQAQPSDEPQQHFRAAADVFAKKNYKAAAADARWAEAYVRREAARAAGDAKHALDDASAELKSIAKALDKGTLKAEGRMDRAFARADHALALAHRARAAESWARKAYDKTGDELKEAASGLENAGAWAGGEAKSGVSGVAADTRAVGDKLARGGGWAKDEVARAFTSLGDKLDQLGRSIGAKSKASPFDAAA